MTTASFDDLEDHVTFVDEENKLAINCFRINFTIAVDVPWIEDDWHRLGINGHEFLAKTAS